MSGTPAKKKIPERRCVVCGERREKPMLVRIVRAPDGTVSVDETGKRSGAYLCRSEECITKALRRGQLSRSLGVPIPEDVLERLEREIGGGE